jgi:hypothetical protein
MHVSPRQSDGFKNSKTSFGPLKPDVQSDAAIPRIVLLPPRVRGAEKADAQLAEALVADITHGLSVLHNLSVIAPHTAISLRDDPNWRDQLAQHNVDYLIDTIISPEGMLFFLVFLPADVVVWFHREKLDPAALAHQRLNFAWAMTSQIAQELEHNRVFHVDYVRSPNAYRLYLTGLNRMKRHTVTNMHWARKAFEQALNECPDFAPAFSGLSRTLTMEWHLRGGGDFDLMRAAEQNARMAIEINPLSPFGHCEYGTAQLFAGNIDQSLKSLSTAVDLGPHYADAICNLGDTLVHYGEPEAGLTMIEHAITLNFLPPDRYFWWASGACFFLNRHEQALDLIARMKAPSSASRAAALSWAMLGNAEKAEIERKRFLEMNPGFDREEWLAKIPFRKGWQREMYREAFEKVGF